MFSEGLEVKVPWQNTSRRIREKNRTGGSFFDHFILIINWFGVSAGGFWFFFKDSGLVVWRSRPLFLVILFAEILGISFVWFFKGIMIECL